MTRAVLTGSRPRRHRMALLISAPVGILSTLVPIGFDEAYWLGVGGMVLSGRSLYSDVIDNKTPLINAVIVLIDRLPGSFQVWRGLAVWGLLAFVVNTLILRAGGVKTTRASPVAVLAASFVLGLLSQFYLTVELLALTAFLGSMESLRAGRAFRGTWLALVAAGLDLRVPLLFPGLVMLVRERLGPASSRRVAWSLGLSTVLAAVTVLVTPDLRYALLETQLGDFGRANPQYGRLLAVFAASCLPFIPLGPWSCWRDGPRSTLLLATAALGIPLLSAGLFPHYYSYLLIPVAAAVSPPPSSHRLGRSIAVVVMASILPLSALTLQYLSQFGMHARAIEGIITQIDKELGGRKYIYFGGLPYVTALRPEQALLPAPTLLYLQKSTSRSESQLAELSRLFGKADVVIDEGHLGRPPEEFGPVDAPLIAAFEPFLDDFPCIHNLPPLRLWMRAESCR